jgi:hypothetical protein
MKSSERRKLVRSGQRSPQDVLWKVCYLSHQTVTCHHPQGSIHFPLIHCVSPNSKHNIRLKVGRNNPSSVLLSLPLSLF